MACASILAVVTLPPAALAQPQDGERVVIATGACGEGPAGASGTCGGEVVSIFQPSPESAGGDAPPSSATPAGPSKRYVPYTRIDTGADGQPCTTTGWREVTDPNVPDGVYQIPDADLGDLGASYAPCPEQPDIPAEVAATPGPVVIATRFWEEIPLPEPQPYIAPGWAITGKLAYLETRGATRHVYRNDTIVGPLEIVATGTYYVDWGDGESSGPHSREGQAWPEGQITHDYIWAGTYDVVVTQRWTATWSLGGQSGVLRQLRTTGRIDDFPARQIQAVVGKP